MLSLQRTFFGFLIVSILFISGGCGVYRHYQCAKLAKQNKKLISGKETYGLKNKKYKKASRKNTCYFVKHK